MYKKIDFNMVGKKITYIYIKDINSENLKTLIDGKNKTFLYTGEEF